MVEVVFALLLLQDHKIIEHRYHESLSNCLKAKRYAMKDKSSKDIFIPTLVCSANIPRVSMLYSAVKDSFTNFRHSVSSSFN